MLARIRRANLDPATLDQQTFANWEKRPGMAQAVAVVKALALGKARHHMVTLLGTPGLGKSHLLRAATREYVLNTGPAAYWQVERLLDWLRAGYHTPDRREPNVRGLTDYDGRLNFVERCGLLALDDWGAHSDSDFARAKLDEVIDARYQQKRATLVATNMGLDQIQPRIADRLKEGTILLLQGQSYREIIAQRRQKAPGKEAPGG